MTIEINIYDDSTCYFFENANTVLMGKTMAQLLSILTTKLIEARVEDDSGSVRSMIYQKGQLIKDNIV